VCSLLETSVPTSPLELASAAYEREVSEVVAADDEIARYVQQLQWQAERDEAAGLDDLPSGDALALELERFLREQGGSP
jgi:hypothetical protein